MPRLLIIIAGSWSQQVIELGDTPLSSQRRGQQRIHLPVSEAVRGSAEGKCGLIRGTFLQD